MVVLDAHEGSGYIWLIILTKIEQGDTFRFFIESRKDHVDCRLAKESVFCQLLGDRCFIPLLEEKSRILCFARCSLVVSE